MKTLSKRHYNISPETRTARAQMMSEKMKGKPKTLEQRQKIGQGVSESALKRQLARPRNTEPLTHGQTR